MRKLTLQQIADSLSPEYAGVAVDEDGQLSAYEREPALHEEAGYFDSELNIEVVDVIDYEHKGNWKESWTPRTKQHKKLPVSHLWGMAVTYGSKNEISIVGDVREGRRKFSIHGIYYNVGEEDFIFTKDPTLPFSEWKSYEMLEEEYNK